MKWHGQYSLVLILVLAFLAVSCGGDNSSNQQPPGMGDSGMDRGGEGGTMGTGQPQGEAGSQSPQATRGQASPVQGNEVDIKNGERIYFTATDQAGQRIPYTGGPDFGGMMMGGYLTCAACHGPEAHGGKHVMHMQVMDAPPIYGAALTEHGEEEHNEGQQPRPTQTTEQGEDHGQGDYTLDDFRLAVVEGQHPDGETLDQDMPRWQMGDEDLGDLLAFLQTIPQ